MKFCVPTSASSSGLFLAAPRRTGKTTFMRADFTPALEERDVLPINSLLLMTIPAGRQRLIVGMGAINIGKHVKIQRREANQPL